MGCLWVKGDNIATFLLSRLFPGVAIFYLAFERFLGGAHMETRVAVLGIIVENLNSIERLNGLLHDYGRYVIGRMGIPYREKNIHVISLAVDAPQDIISSLSGKIGKIDGISVKTAYSNVMTHE